MNLGEALYFFRKNRNLRQSDVFEYFHSSVYSKVENGHRTVSYPELVEILERFSIPLNEFSQYLEESENQRKLRGLFKQCSNNPKNKEKKDELLRYYNSLKFGENMPLKDMSNYVGIKILFSQKWEEISFLSKKEVATIFNVLEKKKYYFEYDYALLSITISLFDNKQLDKMAKKVLPVQDIEIRNNETIEFLKNMMNNLITTLLRKGEYEKSLEYLKLADLKDKEKKGCLEYRVVLKYLENITMYCKTKEIRYKKSVEYYIDFLYRMNEHSLANSISQELSALVSNSKEIPIIIQADM